MELKMVFNKQLKTRKQKINFILDYAADEFETKSDLLKLAFKNNIELNNTIKNIKEKILAIRLSEKDNDFVEEQAEKERLTKSAWVRRKIFINN